MRLDAPADAQRVLLFGGAFDPPHRGHIDLPRLARQRIGADFLLYIPAAAPPLKDGPEAGGEDRIAMLDAALAGDDCAGVTDLELVRGGDSYTLDTLEELRRLLPGAELRLLIGADQARQFHRWREARRVIELAEPVVMLRPPHDDRAALLEAMAPHWTDEELRSWERRLLDLPTHDIASTDLRRLLRERDESPPPKDRAALETLLPAPVLEVVRERRLYLD